MRRSIIVPVKNGAATIGECLTALLEQITDGDEILVVDDHSTDDTAAVLEGFDVRPAACPQGRTGAAAARNVGAARAQGDVLVFVDADVILTPGSLDALTAPLIDGAVGAVGCYDPGDRELGVWSWVKNTTIRVRHRRSGRQIRWFWTAFGAVQKAAFEAVGGFDEAHFCAPTVEDMDLGFRLSADGARIVQVFDAVVHHRHRFGALDLVRNDFKKSRDWARLIARTGFGSAQDHASTGPSEPAALLCSVMALLGLLFSPLTSAGPALALTGLIGLAWLLRDELAVVRAEGSIGDLAAYLTVRAALYPVAGAGALYGGSLWMLKDRRG